MKKLLLSVVAAIGICCSAVAGDFSITTLKPVFAPATPAAGHFKVRVGIKNHAKQARTVNLACLYLGLTRPGFYVKGEPQIQKQYQVLTLQPGQQVDVVLKNKFAAWHPEVVGELLVTLLGDNTSKSVAVETKFRPGGHD